MVIQSFSLVVLALMLARTACDPGRGSSELTVLVDSTSGTIQVHLGASPSTLASQVVSSATLGWRLENTFAEYTSLTDIAVLPDGRLIATSADDDILLIFDSTGRALDTLGRAGPGPGELRLPYIVLADDTLVVAIQSDHRRTLTVFSPAGQVLRTIATPDGGDWVAMKYRGPSLSVNGPGKRPSGMEDPTRRFTLTGGTLFGVIRRSEVSALGAPAGTPVGDAWVLAIDLVGGSLDTIATLSTPPARALEPMAKDVYPLYDVPMYGALPLVAAGPGWVAWASGGDTAVTVQMGGHMGSRPLRIVWPRSARPIDDEDRIAAILNSGEQTLRFADDEMVARVASYSRRELREIAKEYADLWVFADSTPEITALFAAGRCILVAGFARDDYLDGTARTLVAINLDHPERTAVFTVHLPSGRLREADARHLYVTSWSRDGTPVLSAYRLPEIGCAA